ncbi:hydrolase [Clostridium sp. Mt-5]|uniref:Hydrolase n=1 Tax=Clostridium moutaii TaxID=3240932 RepID=A0ABV4BK67_9CLOT
MNTTSCFSKIPEDLQKQIGDLISKSGLSAKDFIKELAYCYNIEDAKSDSIVLDYSNYWNSFVD